MEALLDKLKNCVLNLVASPSWAFLCEIEQYSPE